MGTPQIILTAIILFNSGYAVLHLGEPLRPRVYNTVDVVWAPAITIALLWWGGFY